MAIAASYFQSNSTSGSATVVNGKVTITLPTNYFALEGNKNFVVKLRRGSTAGIVACTTPTITIIDPSFLSTLTANVGSINEGGLVTFNVITSGVPNGYQVYYSIEPRTANITITDFYNSSNTGVVTIIDNQANITVRANIDAGPIDETDEAFALQLRSFSTTGPVISSSANVLMVDLYKTPGYSVTTTAALFLEGKTITFKANIWNYNGPGRTLYYYTIGNVLSSDFTAGNTGTINIPTSSGSETLSNTIILPIASNIPANEGRIFQLAISHYPNSLANATSGSTYIESIEYVSLQATGGTESTITDGANTYKMHVFTSSSTFQITKNTYNTPIEYVLVSGGGAGGGNNGPGPGAPYAYGGGGGAGGLSMSNTAAAIGTYTVTVGGGGSKLAAPAANGQGGNGTDSSITAPTFSTVSTLGGGGGGAGPVASGGAYGAPGGSGGGNGWYVDSGPWNGASPSGQGTPGQGNPGQSPAPASGCGGGGAGTAGFKKLIPGTSSYTGYGGNGIAISWVTPGYGTPGDPRSPGRWFAGGGGGDNTQSSSIRGLGGYGGGANGSGSPMPVAFPLVSGTAFTGGGGGGGYGVPATSSGSAGGSGIVIIRYKYPYPD